MDEFTEADMTATEQRVGELLTEMFSLTGNKSGYHEVLVQEWEFLDETIGQLDDSPFRPALVDCAYRICDAWMSVVGIPLLVKEEDTQRDLREATDELDRYKLEYEELTIDLDNWKQECETLRSQLQQMTESEMTVSKEYSHLQDAYTQAKTTIEILSSETNSPLDPSGDITAGSSEETSELSTPLPTSEETIELENEIAELRRQFTNELDRHAKDIMELEKKNSSLKRQLDQKQKQLDTIRSDLKTAKETIAGQSRFIDQLEKDMGALAIATENPDSAVSYVHGRDATQRFDGATTTRLVSAKSGHYGYDSIGFASIGLAGSLASAEVDDSALSPEAASTGRGAYISPRLFSEPSNTVYYDSAVAAQTPGHERRYSLVRDGSAIGSVILFASSDMTIDVGMSPRTNLALKTSRSTDSESEMEEGDDTRDVRSGTVEMLGGDTDTEEGGFNDSIRLQSDSTVLVSEDMEIDDNEEGDAQGEAGDQTDVEDADDEGDEPEGDDQPLLKGVKRTGTGVASADTGEEHTDFCSTIGCRGLFGW